MSKEELIEALENLERYLRDTPHHNAIEAAAARKALSRVRSADEQPTPPDDLVERKKIVAWLRQKSLDLEAHRAVLAGSNIREFSELADRYRKLADAISRGDHISGEGR